MPKKTTAKLPRCESCRFHISAGLCKHPQLIAPRLEYRSKTPAVRYLIRHPLNTCPRHRPGRLETEDIHPQ